MFQEKNKLAVKKKKKKKKFSAVAVIAEGAVE